RGPHPGRPGPQGRTGQAGGRALRPPLRPPRAPRHGCRGHLRRRGARRLPGAHGAAGRRHRHRPHHRLLAVGRVDHAHPRGGEGVPAVTRVLLVSGLVLWAGATLLLSTTRWFSRRPLTERLRPYTPG